MSCLQPWRLRLQCFILYSPAPQRRREQRQCGYGINNVCMKFLPWSAKMCMLLLKGLALSAKFFNKSLYRQCANGIVSRQLKKFGRPI